MRLCQVLPFHVIVRMLIVVIGNDGSGFIASILSPNASTVWSTGDTVIVRWMSNNTAPDIYPKEGLSIGLYLERRGFDKAIKGATAWYNNFLQGVRLH